MFPPQQNNQIPSQEQARSLMEKYQERISKQLNAGAETQSRPIFSREYQQFKREYIPKKLNYYEKACAISEKILKLKPDAKKAPLLQESIDICHIEVTPSGVVSFSIFGPLLLILFGSLISFAVFNSYFFVAIFALTGILIISPLANMPHFIANNWRMRASNQMVLCIFYVVTFMRHTSNLEL